MFGGEAMRIWSRESRKDWHVLLLSSCAFALVLFSFIIFSEGSTAQIAAAQGRVGKVAFKSIKGMNLAWGLDDTGKSAFSDWLSTRYSEKVQAAVFDQMNTMGVRTVCVWLFLDRMLVKDDSWGTDAYVTRFDPRFQSNWESFLENVVLPRKMQLIVTLIDSENRGHERDPHNFERSAFTPEIAGPDLLGAGSRNGDMEAGKGKLPDGWKVQCWGSKNEVFWRNTGGQTNGSDRYISTTCNSGGQMFVQSPDIPVKENPLLCCSIYGRDDAKLFFTQYLDNTGKVLAQDLYIPEPDEERNGGGGWRQATWASRQGSEYPEGTKAVRISIKIPEGQKASFDTARIAFGRRSAKWHNYIQAIDSWVRLYGSGTKFGTAIVGWQGLKEGYDNHPLIYAHSFSRDIYGAVRSTGTRQIVGTDCSSNARNAVTDPNNSRWYSDTADFYNLHLYNDQGSLPDVSKLHKPFVIGECGASDQKEPDPLLGTQLPRYQIDSWNLKAVSNFFQNGSRSGAILIMPWSSHNPTLIKEKSDGANPSFSLGAVGLWIKDWRQQDPGKESR